MTALIIGANGQLGRALRELMPDARACDRSEFDLASFTASDLDGVSVVYNCAAYTAVDQAEVDVADAWAVNATGVARLASECAAQGITLVHISTDYVFAGTAVEAREDEPVAPMSVYGASKAAGEQAVLASACPSYIVRTSWVVGEGSNFVRTMQSLRARGITPSVVDDQFGRLTFAFDLARFLEHLVTSKAQFGIYHFSNSGPVVSWADIAEKILPVQRVSTAEYFAGRSGIAKRPAHSAFDLGKVRATGFEPRDWRVALEEYLAEEA